MRGGSRTGIMSTAMRRPTWGVVFWGLFISTAAWPQTALQELIRLGGPGAASLQAPPVPPGVPVEAVPDTVLLKSEGQILQLPAPKISLELSPMLNRHWEGSDGYGAGADRVSLSSQFDRSGDPYMAVMGAGWGSPLFYKLERSLSGRWRSNGRIYSGELSISIFRSRTDNYIVIKDESSDRKVLEKHLGDYTARNSFDYFIHKDIGGFLRRELDFYPHTNFDSR